MMKKTSILVFAVIFLSTVFNAQTVPCVDGMAGEFPCCGYDLISVLSLDDMGVDEKGNDIWGWTDPLNGNEYALFGGKNRATFIDITDPENPVFVGFMETQTMSSTWRDIKVFNDHAFIVSEASNHGMQVFDLTRLRDVEDMPFEFEPDAFLGDMGAAHNIAINEETGFAYAIGADTFDGGPSFIDISDPLNPVTVGGYDGDGYTHDAQIVNYIGPDTEHHQREIFFGFNANSLTIVDVTDKTDPIQLSRFEYVQTAYTHQGWLDEDHTLIYLGDEIDEGNYGFNTRTVIIDVSDLDDPVLLEEHFGETTATDHNMYVKDDKIFQSNYASGLRVLQINDDPFNRLEEIAYFDVLPEHNDAGYEGTWSNYPYFESGNIIISSRDRGLFVVHSSVEGSCYVGIEELEFTAFELYPNPALTDLKLTTSEGIVLTNYEIVDVVGSIVASEKELNVFGNSFNVDVSNLASGVYFISINDESNAKRFVVK